MQAKDTNINRRVMGKNGNVFLTRKQSINKEYKNLFLYTSHFEQLGGLFMILR